MSSIDVERARADTPGCAHVLHLNNAGASLPPAAVLDAVVAHLELEARLGGYAAADATADRMEAVYTSVARLIGAQPDEIALVENATRAWDLAFYSFGLGPGDRVLTSRSEYASNVIAMLQVARRRGVSVEVVPDDEHGQLSVDALRAMLDERVRLVAVGWIPTQGGLVNPVAEVGAVTRAAGVPFLLDACQAVGQLVVDVDAIGCDLLSATGRKYLRGPRGTGFLYVRRGLVEALEPPFLDVHSARWVATDRIEVRADARRFETWECSHACRLGLGAAVDYALALGSDAVEERVLALGEQLRAQLGAIPGLELHDQGERRCGIVTFTLDGVDPFDLAARLRADAINISVSTIDFARFDFEARGLSAVARASVHYYNTDDELGRFAATVARMTREARRA
ncbi:MAG TPA: aminotransferase class V-fold PLP-dependent enzyme [Acidimicrobiia bacterium]|nr:aminotransferase class V-fold PLP-dependent enzyme [Acidimicrobiia bacterium]